MTEGHNGADRRRRSASNEGIAPVRRFLKLFSDWVYQALCSELSRESQVRLEAIKGQGTPAWRLLMNRLPKTRQEASVGLSADLDGVLSMLSSGVSPEFQWLAPWASLFRTVPEARPLLAFAGLELAEAFRKVKEPCAQEYVDKAVAVYHDDERTLENDVSGSYPGVLSTGLTSPTVLVGRVMIQYWLHGYSPKVTSGRLVGGKFGPGAVAEKLDHIDRATDLPSWRPCYHTVVEPTYFRTREEWRTWMLRDSEGVEAPSHFPHAESSRMIAVPKTATKPRLIAAEPAANSWGQQSLMEILKGAMARFPYLDITDQTHNQALCLRGLATVDQSRASDRVADILVQALFPSVWVEAFKRTRTESVLCLCGKTHRLSKFAGMGSATTFPVETLVFAACALSRVYLEDGGTPWDDRRAVEAWLRKQQSLDCWGFYGDDAVVPCKWFDSVCDEYRSWGFIPNTEKSYTAPSCFRESCGVMAFFHRDRWTEVSPVRFSSWPSDNPSVSSSFTTVQALNQIRLKIELLSGCPVTCRRSLWTKIPEGGMLWDYSNMKDLLWSPKGLCWWDGVIRPVTPHEYQKNWSRLGANLRPGAICHSVCADDGEIPPSALYVCLSRITGGAFIASDYCGSASRYHGRTAHWVFPMEPSPLRDPRPLRVKVRVGR